MITLTPTEIANLEADACAEIEKSHQAAWSDITSQGLKRPQYEAQFVARLCVAARRIAHLWRPRIRGIDPTLRLSVGSVFTHQTPYVKWTDKTPTGTTAKRCELADLLVVMIDRTGTPEVGRAMLIQAKQSDTGNTTLATASEKKQFELLSTRPVFDVDAIPAPTAVNLKRHTPDDALLYGLTPPDATPVTTATASAWNQHRWEIADQLKSVAGKYAVTASPCLAAAMVEQLQGKRGWSFELPPNVPVQEDWDYFTHPPHMDDWSALMNYLLEVTFGKPLAQLASGGGSPPDRGLEAPLFFVSHTPKGRPMFAILQRDAGGDLPPSGKPEQSDKVERAGAEPWLRIAPTTFQDLFNVEPEGSDAQTEGEGGWENGPISVIVLDLDRRREGPAAH